MIKSKDILLAILICAICLSCSRKEVHIHGNITALPDATVYLKVYEATMRTIDSTTSVNGRFQFKLPDILPNIVFLQFSNADYVPILVDGGEVSVSGNFNYPEEIQIGGTPANNALWEYQQQVRKYNIMLQAIDLDLKQMNYSTKDSLTIKQLTGKRKEIQFKHDNFRAEFVRSNRGSLVSALLVAGMLTDSSSRPVIDSLIGELEPTMADNAFLRRLHRKKNEAQ